MDDFSRGEKGGGSVRLFLEQKIGCAGCVFSGENGGGLVRFYGAEKLQQQVFFA